VRSSLSMQKYGSLIPVKIPLGRLFPAKVL